VKVPHGVYRCQGEDAWVAISVGTDEEWTALCRATGHPEWRDDPRFGTVTGRRRHEDELDSAIDAWTRERTAEEATRILQQAGVPAGPTQRPEDLLQDPQLCHRGFIVETEHPRGGRRRHPGAPWRMGTMGAPTYRPAPLLGEHTHWVLTELLGLSESEYGALEAEGVLS
jgi:crotonobetainyl-CoA:carnitine CoA-transferase CaiB-like acyl-CoA transferase